MYVVIGEYDLSVDTNTEQTIVASELIMHEHYDGQTFTNDVGLLHLIATITFTDTVAPIGLPTPMEVLEDGVLVTTTGWGAAVEGGYVEDILRKVSYTAMMFLRGSCKGIQYFKVNFFF